MTNSNSDGLVRAVVAILAVIILAPLLMMGVAAPMMGLWWAGGTMGGFSPVVGLVMLVLWVAIITGVGYLVYRGLSGSSSGSDPALEELRVAYARGDLTDEEFEERLDRLGGAR